MTAPPSAVVLDHTALLALGTGHRTMAGLVAEAHTDNGRHVYLPALCLAAAVGQRSALADHVGLLPAVQIVDLDYPAASTVGRLLAAGVGWQAAHAITVGLPTADWPTGRPVLTREPGTYAGWGVRVMDLS